MKPNLYNNTNLDIVSAFESYAKYLNNEYSLNEMQNIIQNSCNKECGSCSGFYTANTIAILLESMGLTLPNSSSNISLSFEKINETYKSGKIINDLLENDLKPLDLITRETLLQSIKILYSIGESTNAILHLLALAHESNIKLDLDDFINFQNIPVVTNMKPHGKHVMYDLYKNGGTSLLFKYLIDNNIIDGNNITVNGNKLIDNVREKSYNNLLDENIIYNYDNPFKKNSHIKILKGNITKNGCISKIYKDEYKFEGPILVYDSEEEMINSLNNNEITNKHFVLIRYQGESVGCPEMLSPTSALIGYFGNNSPPMGTDGRFSGGSNGSLICNLPDDYKDNIISKIKSGDIICINNEKNKISLKNYDEINKREKKIKLLNHSGYLQKYSKLVNNLSYGFSTFN